MAASTVPKVRRDGSITLIDGTSPTALEYVVSYEDGDLTFSGDKADRVVIRDRGTIVGVRLADDPVQSLSFSVHMRDFTDGTSTNLVDVITQAGAASAWKSVASGAYSPYLLNCRLNIEGTDHDDTSDHSAVLASCLFTYSFSEGDPNVINVSAEVYGSTTFTGQS